MFLQNTLAVMNMMISKMILVTIGKVVIQKTGLVSRLEMEQITIPNKMAAPKLITMTDPTHKILDLLLVLLIIKKQMDLGK